jgi:hypothetical protein
MSKPATGPLSPIPTPLEAVHDEVASAIAEATPSGAFETGFRRLQAFAMEHPEFELSIVTAVKNLREELAAFAATSGGGPRIAARLRLLENELRGRVGRPDTYTPTPPRPSAFGPSPQPGPMAGRYPWLDPSSGLPR